MTLCRLHISTVAASNHQGKTEKPQALGEPKLCIFNTFSQHFSPPNPLPTTTTTQADSVSGWWLLGPSPHHLLQPPIVLVFLDFGFSKPALLLCWCLWIDISNNRTLLLGFDFPASVLLPGFAFSMRAAGHLWTLLGLDTSTHYSTGQTLASLSAGWIHQGQFPP